LFDKTTHWFDRAKAALSDELPCRQGCFHCCVGLFSVTILDRREIRRGLCSVAVDERLRIERLAGRQVALLSEATARLQRHPFIDDWPDEETDRLMEHFDRLPCPALKSDGSCGLYAFRPLVCRSMGIPVEVDGLAHGACGIQTSVPLIQVSRTLRQEEDLLARAEADELARLRQDLGTEGEELLLPYAFLPDDARVPGRLPT
jgi:Fe-S-cluster containining protein